MTRAPEIPGCVGHRSYDTDVTVDSDRTLRPTATGAPDADRDPRIDLDPRSAIPIAIAFAILAVVDLVRPLDPAHAGAHRDRVAARVRADTRGRGAAPAHRLAPALRGRGRARQRPA